VNLGKGNRDMVEAIRWKQRFENLERVYLFLEESVSQKTFTKLEQAGLVQAFEFTFELSWKTLKDYLKKGGFSVVSPRDVIKQAFQNDYIKDGHLWIEMLEKRNELTHTYSEKEADAASKLICETYFPAIQQLVHTVKGFK
jgi:nucleotidyltransferase substrate binding protein (TIGR01987 family)